MPRPETSAAERLKTLLLMKLVPPLAGQPLGDWLHLMRDHRFDVDLPFWPRAFLNVVCSFLTTLMKRREERKYNGEADVPVPPPLFVLGHYRSGTTHLHNLLAVDRRFTFPTMFRNYNPYTFRVFGPVGEPFAAAMVPRRRIVDRMAWGADMPQEDELGLMMLTGMSPYMGFVFPRRWEQFERYLSFRDATPVETSRWKQAVNWFLKKLTRVDGRPLLLKSPPHTARVRLLLELFPDARFVHIHRDPYTVFQSSCQLIERVKAMFSFQRSTPQRIPGRVLRHYRLMYDAFFADRPLIPEGQFHEVRFDDLEREPVGQIEQVYARLKLPDFVAVRPALEEYVASLKGYRRNEYPPLPEAQRRAVAEAWERNFEAWDYTL